jgi:hypothetical protein
MHEEYEMWAKDFHVELALCDNSRHWSDITEEHGGRRGKTLTTNGVLITMQAIVEQMPGVVQNGKSCPICLQRSILGLA